MITFANCGAVRAGKTEPEKADPCSCGNVTVTLELVSEDAAQGGYYLAPHIFGVIFSDKKGEEDGLSNMVAYFLTPHGGDVSVDTCQALSWGWECASTCHGQYINNFGGACPDGRSFGTYEDCCYDRDNPCPGAVWTPLYCSFPCYTRVPMNSENKNGRKTFTLARNKKYHISWYANGFWIREQPGGVCVTPVKYSWKITVGTADDLDKEGAKPAVIAEGGGTTRTWVRKTYNPTPSFPEINDDNLNLLEKVSFTA